MAPPSYLRPTASSTLRASPKSSETAKTDIQKETPRKLKRPSTLSTEDRHTIAYNANLHPIKPQSPTKPCPLSTLPSELRSTIYTYILDQHSPLPSPGQVQTISVRPDHHRRHDYTTPSLLHICRAIRIEAAYTYYTTTPFTWTVRNLNFAPIISYMESLPHAHRALLARNPHKTINVIPRVVQAFTYAPAKYLLDGMIEDHWKACEAFGNLYALSTDVHRKQFIIFCRLATWWLWCAGPEGNRDVAWTYTFEWEWRRGWGTQVWREDRASGGLCGFLRDCVGVFMAGSVKRAWTRNVRKKGMRREVERLLEALDGWNERVGGVMGNGGDEWGVVMGRIWRVLEKW